MKSLLLLSLFFSCASTGLDNAVISIERSPCLGYCFAFAIQIDSKGHYTASNLKNQSTVEGLLSKEQRFELNKIIRSLNRVASNPFKSNRKALDIPSLKIKHGDDSILIENRQALTPESRKLVEWSEKLIKSPP